MAMKLNIKQTINENKKKLQEANKNHDKKEIRFLKRCIRGDKQFIRLLKYFGSQFGMIEKIWFTGVFMSFILTIIGIIIIFRELS